MGTVVLRPQNCFENRFPHELVTLTPDLGHRRNPKASPNGSRSRRRNRSPSESKSHQQQSPDRSPPSRSAAVKSPPKNMVMGQVKILKRGEEIGIAKSEDLVIGPEPEVMQKQIIMDCIYAGSGFFTSPPPSSVPRPNFLSKNGAATIDLRRLLKLDSV